MSHLRTRAVAVGGATLLALGAGLVLAPLAVSAPAPSVNRSPDSQVPFSPAANQVSYWCEDGFKLDSGFSDPYQLTANASKLIIKSALVNDVWDNPAPGWYGTQSGKEISHIIVCDGDDSEESPTPTPTETETGTPTPTPTETETGTPTPTETPTDPGTTTPAPTDPATTDPATTDPATTDPATTVPATSDPATVPTLASTGGSSHWALVSAGLALLLAGLGLIGMSRRSGTHA